MQYAYAINKARCYGSVYLGVVVLSGCELCWAVYQWDGDKGTGTSGRVCGDLGLGDTRRGTWGHQVWDEGTCGTGTRGRQMQGRRGCGMRMIIAKVGGKCDISFLVKMCYLWSTLGSIVKNHIGHLTDVYTKYFCIIRVSALTIMIRVRVDFHCCVIFSCVRT